MEELRQFIENADSDQIREWLQQLEQEGVHNELIQLLRLILHHVNKVN